MFASAGFMIHNMSGLRLREAAIIQQGSMLKQCPHCPVPCRGGLRAKGLGNVQRPGQGKIPRGFKFRKPFPKDDRPDLALHKLRQTLPVRCIHAIEQAYNSGWRGSLPAPSSAFGMVSR